MPNITCVRVGLLGSSHGRELGNHLHSGVRWCISQLRLYNKYHRMDSLNNRNLFLHSPGGCECVWCVMLCVRGVCVYREIIHSRHILVPCCSTFSYLIFISVLTLLVVSLPRRSSPIPSGLAVTLGKLRLAQALSSLSPPPLSPQSFSLGASWRVALTRETPPDLSSVSPEASHGGPPAQPTLWPPAGVGWWHSLEQGVGCHL